MNISQKLIFIGFKKIFGAYILFAFLTFFLAYYLNVSVATLILMSLITGSVVVVLLFLGLFYLKQNFNISQQVAQIEQNLERGLEQGLNKVEARINLHTTDTLFWNVNQIEASTYLQSFISPRIPLPNTRQGAASPDFLSTIFQKIILNRPQTIVELGSGVSTLFMGHLLRDHKIEGKIHSIDHDEFYFKIIQENIIDTGLNNEVSPYHCPLIRQSIKGKERLWYDISNLTVTSIDLLIIDGPPGWLEEKMRYPAIPMLIDRLTEGALIIVDDYKRQDDSEMVKDWLKENTQLLLIAELNSEKGTAVIRKSGK
jgi:predicted O-methyltransferase YrrM